MIYAVLDTNVLVSALLSKSAHSTISQLITAVIEEKLIPVYNDEILKEYKEVLSREKFHFLPELQKALVNFIKDKGFHADRIPYGELMPDESDRVFYEVALSKDNTFLVTGNLKHFPKTPIVVTPAEMLEILLTISS